MNEWAAIICIPMTTTDPIWFEIARLRNRLPQHTIMVAWKCYYTIRMFPPAIDIIPTLLAVVYSNRKYTN